MVAGRDMCSPPVCVCVHARAHVAIARKVVAEPVRQLVIVYSNQQRCSGR
jgi:hypothetical protein